MKKNRIEHATQRLVQWVGLCLLVISMGCSSEDVGQQAECTSDDDCVAPKTCIIAQGVCEYVRTDPGRPSNPGELLPGQGDAGNSLADTEAGRDGESSHSPDVGVGGDDASPSEFDTGVDHDAEVIEPTCEVNNQSCDSALPHQGDFVCVPGSRANSICRKACDRADHPSTCEAGHFCREHNVNGTVVLGCAVGGCESNRDCDHMGPLGGNCIDKGSGYNECVAGGTSLEGQACQGGAGDNCMEGTVCRVTNSSTGSGVCARLCNPWGTILMCPGNQFCEPTMSGNGICSSNVVTRAVRQYYDTCNPNGAMCYDAAKCLGFQNGNNYCVPYCRAGKNDCAGIYGPGFFGKRTYCDLTVFSNTNQFGYCLEI